MAPDTTLHIVRHAQGFHQLPLKNPNVNIRDPELSPYGVAQCQHLRESFPHHATVDLIAASPLRRAVQTALYAFAPVLASTASRDESQLCKVLALPDAQEASNAPSDTGSDAEALRGWFGDRVSLELVDDQPSWYAKEGANGVDRASLEARAARLLRYLRARPEREIVLVTHGLFAHYLTGNIDADGNQTGAWWTNVRWRSFRFREGDEPALEETEESLRRAAAGEANEHPPEEKVFYQNKR